MVTTSDTAISDALSAYPAGHHASVLKSHVVRNAANSAPHLLPYIKSGQTILDIGCGPGSISLSFAELVGATGKVTGVDASESVITEAKALASANANNVSVSNLEFQVADGAALPFPDSSFDIVHTHQVLQHVKDPVSILREMRRLAKKPDGIISLREGDMESIVWYPPSDILSHNWRRIWYANVERTGGCSTAGRQLHVWCKAAGIKREEMISKGAGTWCYGQTSNDPSEYGGRVWWANLWVERVTSQESGFYKTAVKNGDASPEEMEEIGRAWRQWGADEDAWFGMVHGEVVCKLGVPE